MINPTPAQTFTKLLRQQVPDGHGGQVRCSVTKDLRQRLYGFLAIPVQRAVVEAFRNALLARRRGGLRGGEVGRRGLEQDGHDLVLLAAVERLVCWSEIGFSLEKLSPSAAAEAARSSRET